MSVVKYIFLVWLIEVNYMCVSSQDIESRYSGCVQKRSNADRSFPQDQENAIDHCQRYCEEKGNAIFGLQKYESSSWVKCFCGDSVYGAKVADSQCNERCNHGEHCGGPASHNLISTFGDVDECNTNNNPCGEQTRCLNNIGSYSCITCDQGYHQDPSNVTRCTDIDECVQTPAVCGGALCENHRGNYSCTCNTGYQLSETKDDCLDINECDESNGGCSHICENQDGTYRCSCNNGYQLANDGVTCADIDECSSPGRCDVSCTNTDGGFTCVCKDGETRENENCPMAMRDAGAASSSSGGCGIALNGWQHQSLLILVVLIVVIQTMF